MIKKQPFECELKKNIPERKFASLEEHEQYMKNGIIMTLIKIKIPKLICRKIIDDVIPTGDRKRMISCLRKYYISLRFIHI